FNFRGMMAVIVNHHDAARFPFELKTPAGASETSERFGDLHERHVQLKTKRDRRERVVNIMQTRHAQGDVANHVRSMPNRKDRSKALVVTNSMRGDVGLGAET